MTNTQITTTMTNTDTITMRLLVEKLLDEESTLRCSGVIWGAGVEVTG